MKFFLGMLALYAIGAVLIIGILANEDTRDWIVKQWPELGASGR